MPSESSADGTGVASRRVIVVSRCTTMLPAATPSKNPSVARPIAPLTISSIVPRGTRPSWRSLNCRLDTDPIELTMLRRTGFAGPCRNFSMPRLCTYGNNASPIRVSSSILKLRKPPIFRGTFHSSCRATTCVLAATSLTGTVTSQADLP